MRISFRTTRYNSRIRTASKGTLTTIYKTTTTDGTTMINLNTLPIELQVKELQLRIHFLQHAYDIAYSYCPKELKDTLYFEIDEYSRQYWTINKPERLKNQND
jgi:hypothetical protein